jgi:lysophospholipase L1-like esterase
MLVGCLVAEVGLRLFRPQIFALHPPGLYVADPAVGYVLAPGFEGKLRRAEFHTQVRVGQSGLRGPDHSAAKSNSWRILVLGDSLAWGFGVEDDQTFGARLEELLADSYAADQELGAQADVQVLNGAVPGYGTADELAWLRTRGPALEPDLVIVQFLSVNDIQENPVPASEWAEIQDGMLTVRESSDPSAARPGPGFAARLMRVRYWLKRHLHVAALGFDIAGYLSTRAGLFGRSDAVWGEDFSAEDAELATELLVQVALEAEKLGAQALYLYTTGQAQVIQTDYARLRSANVVDQAAERAGVPWIDVTEQMRQRADRYELYYPKDGHWTAAGHQAVAEILAKELVGLGLIRADDH